MSDTKCTHYLLRPYDMPEDEFEKIKESYTNKGNRVVVLAEGQKSIHEGLKSILLNHI